MLPRRMISIAFMLSAVTVFASDAGAKLFKQCIVCHGVNAQKKSLDVSEVIAGWPAEKIVKELKGYRDGKIDKYGFGKMMMGQSTKLNDIQIMQVAQFVEGLKPEKVNKMKEKRISVEDARYNTFLKDYFLKNRNGTTKEVKMLWKKHLLEGAK